MLAGMVGASALGAAWQVWSLIWPLVCWLVTSGRVTAVLTCLLNAMYNVYNMSQSHLQREKWLRSTASEIRI
ncbi:hypothetical protein EDB19DRAFT_1728808 [Suillus lakei]|nr:hypothetical protein EDB19DRAFT_1728808 [Suillus lakei]